MGEPAIRIDAMTPDEQLDLLERLWDSRSARASEVAVTDAHRRELDRRLDALEVDTKRGAQLGIPWDEVQRHIRARR